MRTLPFKYQRVKLKGARFFLLIPLLVGIGLSGCSRGKLLSPEEIAAIQNETATTPARRESGPGIAIISGAQTMKSQSVSTDVQVSFVGTSGASVSSPIQSSHSLLNLRGPGAGARSQ